MKQVWHQTLKIAAAVLPAVMVGFDQTGLRIVIVLCGILMAPAVYGGLYLLWHDDWVEDGQIVEGVNRLFDDLSYLLAVLGAAIVISLIFMLFCKGDVGYVFCIILYFLLFEGGFCCARTFCRMRCYLKKPR